MARRSAHSAQRRFEGRRTGPAFQDAQRATRADVAWDASTGRFVVHGPRARYQIFEPDGTHVTQVSYTAKIWRDRHARGRWLELTDQQWAHFVALFHQRPENDDDFIDD